MPVISPKKAIISKIKENECHGAAEDSHTSVHFWVFGLMMSVLI
jgi:hypothetical protein